MSELIAEARVLVTPDVTTFRPLLISELAAATKGVTVPVSITPVVTGGTAAGAAAIAEAQSQIAAATGQATGALRLEQLLLAQGAADLSVYAQRTDEVVGATVRKSEADKIAAKSAAAHARRVAGLSSGAASAGLSLVGLRGATLAASAPFLAGAAGALAFTKALSTFAAFESQLNVFAATTGATANEISRVSETAKALGRDITLPGVSAGDAAEAMTEFAKAGLSVEDAMVAARGGLQLATAAQISNAQAVELAAGALNAFNLEGEEAVRVADVLANAANAAQGSITDTALALRQAAGAAAVVGVSFEDTVALLTLLARNGLVGSDAGTALRTSFIRLVNPSKEANAILERLNITLRDAAGNVRPEVYAEFAAAHRGMSRAVFQSNAAVVFGQDAFRAIGIFAKEGAAGLNEARQEMERTGTAAEIAGARTKGLAGATENLKNQLSGLGITIGTVTAPFAEAFVNSLAGMAREANRSLGFLGDLADRLGLIGSSAEDVEPTLEGLTTALSDAQEELQKFLDTGGQEEQTGTMRRNIAELTDQLVKLAGTLGREKFFDALIAASPLVRQAVKDGVITPTERAQLEADALGLAFVKAMDEAKGAVSGFPTTLQRAMDLARQEVADAAAAMRAALANIAPAQSALDLALAQAGGDQGEELSILRDREARQEKFLNALLRREQTPKTVALATKAAQNLDRTRAAIESIIQQQQSAAKAASDRIIAQARAADQSFLEGLAVARQNQENQIAIAAQTAGTADDLREQRELRELIQKQIEAIRASSVAEKTKQDAIRALTAAKIATIGTIKQLAATAAAERSAQRTAAAELNFSTQELLAQLTESDRDNERVLRAQIRFFAAEARRLGVATNAGKEMRIRALEFVVQLRELLKARAEAAGELEDAQQGTSVADLLRENARIFAQSASNVIGGDQPFDSPAAFSSSLARFLTPVSGKPQIEVVAKRDTATSAIDRQIQKLIDALNLNTNALTGGGPTGGKDVDVQVRRDRALKSFYESTVARDRLDARRSGI